ncbi:MAG: glycerophosphodiester phosphodiesterase [Propionicimonas sp.]
MVVTWPIVASQANAGPIAVLLPPYWGPMNQPRPYFDTTFQAMAHRGGTLPDGGAENTLAAFARAVEVGYRYLETDVHASSDGVLFAFHDESLDRVTDATGPIGGHTAHQLAQVRVHGGERIPTLAELFETFPHARFNLDLKASGAVAPLAEAVLRHAAESRVCVSSFSTQRITEFRRLSQGRVATGLSRRAITGFLAVPRLAASWVAGDVLQVPLRFWGDRLPLVTRRLIGHAHRCGLHVHAWTVNDPVLMGELIDLGVDGLVTDDLEALKLLLTERGMWEGSR